MLTLEAARRRGRCAGTPRRRQPRRRARAAQRQRPRCGAGAAPPHRATPARADLECDMLVLGAGPGGYSAAFRAADLGMKVVLVERYATLGGVCLNVGCIPSKALLHVAAVMDEVKPLRRPGRELRRADRSTSTSCAAHKNKVVGKLTGGLAAMAKMRKVTVVRGIGEFVDPYHLEVEETSGDGQERPARRRPSSSSNCDHRGRLAGGAAAVHAEGPARRRLHRRARTARATPSAC